MRSFKIWTGPSERSEAYAVRLLSTYRRGDATYVPDIGPEGLEELVPVMRAISPGRDHYTLSGLSKKTLALPVGASLTLEFDIPEVIIRALEESEKINGVFESRAGDPYFRTISLAQLLAIERFLRLLGIAKTGKFPVYISRL